CWLDRFVVATMASGKFPIEKLMHFFHVDMDVLHFSHYSGIAISDRVVYFFNFFFQDVSWTRSMDKLLRRTRSIFVICYFLVWKMQQYERSLFSTHNLILTFFLRLE